MRICSVAVLTATVLVACAALPAQSGDRPAGRPFATRSEVIARNGVAATSHPLATQIAIDILKKGGSAVDAAIAADAALGLMEPMSCGIGGDLFALIWDAKTNKLYGLNASGRSPYGLTLEHFKSKGLEAVPARGPLPVTVPGCVDGWFELHARFGRLPMRDILAPVIEYARNGFPVSQIIAQEWQTTVDILKDQPGFLATYAPNGKAPAKGEVFRNPDLARSYQLIAEQGRDAFYRGEIAGSIDAFSSRVGCFLRLRDLAEHRSEWVEPVSTDYRGYDVWAIPPNGQGIAVLQMLNILEGFDLRGMGHNNALYLHHLIEAKKIAYEDRAVFYADPDVNRLPVAELISKNYAAGRRKLLDPTRANRRIAPGNPRMDQGDTIYLTVADKDRNMVSLIQSVFFGFGCGMVPDGCGFALQNRGQAFNLSEGHVNTYAPHKRPFHTIIPGFVTRGGRPWLSFGVMGGDMQPQGQVQVLCNLIDFGMNVQEAADAARFRHGGSSEPSGRRMTDGGEVRLESGIGVEVRNALSAMGHNVAPVGGPYGGCQAILYDEKNDVYIGASESRKDGQASGY